MQSTLLIVAGIADGMREIAKASGIRINLWAGIGMLPETAPKGLPKRSA